MNKQQNKNYEFKDSIGSVIFQSILFVLTIICFFIFIHLGLVPILDKTLYELVLFSVWAMFLIITMILIISFYIFAFNSRLIYILRNNFEIFNKKQIETLNQNNEQIKTKKEIIDAIEYIEMRKSMKLNQSDSNIDFLSSIGDKEIECIKKTLEWVVSKEKLFFDIKQLKR